jgi:hypothetical protein
MIILVIPPWALNIKDFLSFINTGTVRAWSLFETLLLILLHVVRYFLAALMNLLAHQL